MKLASVNAINTVVSGSFAGGSRAHDFVPPSQPPPRAPCCVVGVCAAAGARKRPP